MEPGGAGVRLGVPHAHHDLARLTYRDQRQRQGDRRGKTRERAANASRVMLGPGHAGTANNREPLLNGRTTGNFSQAQLDFIGELSVPCIHRPARGIGA